MSYESLLVDLYGEDADIGDRGALRGSVEVALGKIHRDYSYLIRARYFEEKSLEEIAKSALVDLPTVNLTLSVALGNLRRRIV